MGIQGLLPMLKDIQKPGHIKEFRGKRLAIDAYVWLHKGAFGCAEDLVKGKKTTKFVDYAMHRVRLLKYHGITPFIVFDGGPLPAKKGTEVSRAKSRAESLARAQAYESQGQMKMARECYTKCVDITPEMAYQLIKALRAENIEYIVAPYEADAQLCYLEREGFVDGIITEDSDLLVFGCKHVIFKLDNNGHCIHIHRDDFTGIRDFPMHGWTDLEFRRMAMLSGCDYLDSIQGIGIKTAHRLLRKHKTVEKVLQSIRFEGAMRVPENYARNFSQAELAFIYQRIYCPDERKFIPLNPFPEEGLQEDDEKWVGLDVSVEVARGMASGELHPETREPIEDLWPEFKPQGNGATKQPLRDRGSSNIPPAGNSTLDGFITRKKVVRTAPIVKPIGASASGPSRLSELGSKGLWGSKSPPKQIVGGAKSKFFASRKDNAMERTIAKAAKDLVWESSDPPELQEEEQDESLSMAVNVESPLSKDLPKSPSPFTQIRSPSPIVSSMKIGESSSPMQRSPTPIRRGGSSPMAVSSPASSISSSGAIFSPDRVNRSKSSHLDTFKKESEESDETPSSPTPSVILATQIRSSQIVISETQTPLANIRNFQPFSRVILPNSSSPGGILGTQIPDSIGATPTSNTHRLPTPKFDWRNSSDSIQGEDDMVVTPSAETFTPLPTHKMATGSTKGKVGNKKRKSPSQEDCAKVVVDENDEIINSDEERRMKEEEIVRERHQSIAAGWKAKYALQANFTPKPSSVKRHKSNENTNTATPTTGSAGLQGINSFSITKMKTLIPLSASAPMILASRPTNIPSTTTAPMAEHQDTPLKAKGTNEVTPSAVQSAKRMIQQGEKGAAIISETPPRKMTWGGLSRFAFDGKIKTETKTLG